MSSPSVTDAFLDWFRKLSRQEQEALLKYLASTGGQTALKGIFAGPIPVQPGRCPLCGK